MALRRAPRCHGFFVSPGVNVQRALSWHLTVVLKTTMVDSCLTHKILVLFKWFNTFWTRPGTNPGLKTHPWRGWERAICATTKERHSENSATESIRTAYGAGPQIFQSRSRLSVGSARTRKYALLEPVHSALSTVKTVRTGLEFRFRRGFMPVTPSSTSRGVLRRSHSIRSSIGVIRTVDTRHTSADGSCSKMFQLTRAPNRFAGKGVYSNTKKVIFLCGKNAVVSFQEFQQKPQQYKAQNPDCHCEQGEFQAWKFKTKKLLRFW